MGFINGKGDYIYGPEDFEGEDDFENEYDEDEYGRDDDDSED